MRQLDMRPAIPVVTAPPRETPAPAPAAKRAARGHRGRWLMLLGLLVAGLAIGATWWARPQPVAPAPAVTAVAPKLTARGQIRPVAQARVGTLSSGVVIQLSVELGQVVDEEQEIARVRGPNGTEVVSAPWRGTVTSLPARVGDTVVAGATLATVSDLRRVQVETTDVDEFLIAQVRRGRAVTLTVDALDDRPYTGIVRSVTLEPQTNATGDENYPVVIDIADPTPDLFIGMTVHITFPG